MANRVITISLTNEYDDRRQLLVVVEDDAPIEKVIVEAEQLANAQPPQGWPVGSRTGTWTAVGVDA